MGEEVHLKTMQGLLSVFIYIVEKSSVVLYKRRRTEKN
jgi:hypothetical protein